MRALSLDWLARRCGRSVLWRLKLPLAGWTLLFGGFFSSPALGFFSRVTPVWALLDGWNRTSNSPGSAVLDQKDQMEPGLKPWAPMIVGAPPLFLGGELLLARPLRLFRPPLPRPAPVYRRAECCLDSSPRNPEKPTASKVKEARLSNHPPQLPAAQNCPSRRILRASFIMKRYGRPLQMEEHPNPQGQTRCDSRKDVHQAQSRDHCCCA